MDANPLAQIWHASAHGRSLSREDVANFAVESAAKLAQDPDLSLRAEGHLVFGLSQIWAARAALLLQDAVATDEGIGSAFREYLAQVARSQSEGGDARRAQLLDFDFDELSIPQSLLSDPPSQPLSAGEAASQNADLSIDDIMRGDEGGADLEPDTVVRSAEQQQSLANEIDFDLGGDLNDLPGPLDFGSELEYSSSPPHTPLGDDVEVQIGEEAAAHPVPKPRRKRQQAAVDEVTTLPRRTRPPATILRPLPEPPLVLSPLVPVPSASGLDAATEKLVDPEVVYAEMKRRRNIGEPEEFDPNADFDGGLDGDFDAGLGGSFDGGFDGDVDMLDDEAELTEEMLEAEQKEAKRVIKAELGHRGKSAQFSDLAAAPGARACMLIEVLGMAAKGRLRVEQPAAFGEIRLTRV